MTKRKLNDKQIAAITILATPGRAGLTYDEVADKVGVSRQTLLNWRNAEYFSKELARTIVRNTVDDLPEIFASIPGHIINDGNAAMFRTLLQAQGLLTERVEVETSDRRIDLGALKSQLSGLKSKDAKVTDK